MLGWTNNPFQLSVLNSIMPIIKDGETGENYEVEYAGPTKISGSIFRSDIIIIMIRPTIPISRITFATNATQNVTQGKNPSCQKTRWRKKMRMQGNRYADPAGKRL